KGLMPWAYAHGINPLKLLIGTMEDFNQFLYLSTMMRSILRILYITVIVTTIISTVKSQEKITPVFNHLALSVKDLPEITAFYRDVLLLEQIEEPFKDGKHSWFNLGPGLSLHIIEDAKETQEHPR